MSPKKNLILLLSLLLAGGVYYLVDVKWAGEKKAEEERKAKILKGIDPKALMRISVQRKEEPFQIIRTEKIWRFVKPVDAAMDEDQTEIVLKAAADLKPGRKVGKVSDISEFGLDKPQMSITFGLKGKDAVTVQIGDRTPTREFRYASLKSNKSTVFTLKIDDINKINKKVFDLRDRSIVSIDPDAAKRIRIEPTGQIPFTVIRKGEDGWEMIEPVKDAGDGTEADSILSTLRYQKVVRFVEEDPKDLAPYGLDKPGYTVRIFTDKEGKKGDGIHLGLTTEEEVADRQGRMKKQVLYYVRRVSGGPVVLVGNEVVKDLPREPFKLRKKVVIDYDVDNITRLKLETGAEKIDILRLGKKKWEMKAAGAAGKAAVVPARHKHIDDVLWDIKWSNAVEFVDEPGEDLTSYGLGAKGVRRVSLWIKKKKDGPEAKRSFIMAAPNDEGRAYGRMEGKKRLFAFAKKDFDKIFRSSFYLSDRRFTPFEKEEDIVRVTVKFPSGAEAVLRREGEDWIAEKPKGEKASTGMVDGFLNMMKDLEYEGDAGGGGDFKNFRARVFLEHKSGKKFPAVIFAGGGGKKISFVEQGGKAYRVKTVLIGPNLPASPASLMVEKKKPKK